MDWAYIQEVGNILIIVDAGSGWIEAFICGDRPTEKVIHCMSTIFGRFGVPHTLVSDNAKEFINHKVVTWLQVQGCTKLESPIYNPRKNGLAERAVQTVKKAMRAWNSSLRVSFHAFLQRVLFTHRNTSSVRGKTPSEVLLGRKMRLPAVINYPIGGLGTICRKTICRKLTQGQFAEFFSANCPFEFAEFCRDNLPNKGQL